MRTLVVGGSGLVGTLALPALTQQHTVRVFDRRPPRTDADVDYVAGDLGDLDAIASAVRGMEAVVFMAMGPKEGFGDPVNDRTQFEVSVTGLYTVLRAAFDEGIRHAVYTSSMSVYHLTDELRDLSAPYPDESQPPNAIDPYGLSKRLGEEVCRAATIQGMSVVALRLCFPVPDAEWPPSPAYPRHATIATSGRDTASAILLALEYRGHGFQAFAISGDGTQRIVPTSKARDILGWTPLDPTPALP